MNTKKYKWIAGCLCALPLVVSAQQTEPLTDHRRLFDDGKELFCVTTMLQHNRR